jgi:hypothetical protein
LDRGIGEVDVLQVKVQQETVMICHPMECLAQFLSRSLDPPIRQSRQLDRIGLSPDQSLDHRSPTLADDVCDD